jgi:glycosyltransferase involved in cell wall biosynthesis
VISEAWARNKPVIASAVGEIPYRVKHMINGILVPPKNPQKLAEAIITLLNDKNLRTKLGTEGRESILTWSEIATRIATIYKQS